jgi:hypothetical protein
VQKPGISTRTFLPRCWDQTRGVSESSRCGLLVECPTSKLSVQIQNSCLFLTYLINVAVPVHVLRNSAPRWRKTLKPFQNSRGIDILVEHDPAHVSSGWPVLTLVLSPVAIVATNLPAAVASCRSERVGILSRGTDLLGIHVDMSGCTVGEFVLEGTVIHGHDMPPEEDPRGDDEG